MSKSLRFFVNLEGFSPNMKSASKEMMLQLPLSPTICRKLCTWLTEPLAKTEMHGYRVFLQISFEVVAVFAKHHQEDTGIPNHFALPGVHGQDTGFAMGL
jgi:hypothetical protein